MSTVAAPHRAPVHAEPRIPGAQAAACSVLGFGAAVGVGHLVAGVVSPLSSPYQAVADAVVRLAPSGLVEFGKSLALPGLPAGKADKFGLLLGVGVVLVLVAVLAGLASRRDVRPGRRVITGLGLVGLAAVVSSPVFTLPDVVAPLASLGAGLWAFRWLHERAMALAVDRAASSAANPVASRVAVVPRGRADPDAGPDPDDPPSTVPIPRLPGPGGRARHTGPPEEVSRRQLLLGSAAVGVGAAGAGVGGYLLGAGVDVADSQSQVAEALHPAQPAAPLPAGADFAAQGTPTFLTANRDFYRIDTALRLPAKAATDWSMKVHGLVERELMITYQDLLDRPLIERPVTLTCVSNEVGGNLISTANFLGVSLRDLLLEAGVRPGADQLFSTSLDGFTAGTPVEVVLEPDRGAMLALGMNAGPLPLEHGYPVRMVVPGLYGFVSATKWLADLELTTFDAKQSYWLQRGWSQQAPIKTQSRIDRPQQGSSVPAGPFTAAGIAWAQHRGISNVEVRMDGGAWQQAQLSTEVSSDTWRMWRIDLTVPPGNHLLECRATDRTGQTQTAVHADPVPDGATGWPSVQLTAH
ncbi:MAG TPA: molybdopterin-dependent oxidoreductase [Pseudonocardia sp.]|nr:molybdopterin-dependent oxidoreductase [Pseudonocardia sp.]